MNLFSNQLSFWPWFLKVLYTFFKARPLATLTVIVTTSIAQITSLLSTLLPLKIILLAGSEGVPRYFAFFINPDEKASWIIILSIATVGAFIATSLFETISKKLSHSVSGEVLETANEITVFSNQEKKASSYYSRFCSVVSSFIFILLSFLALRFVNFPLFIFLLSAILIQFLTTSLIVSGDDGVNCGRLKGVVVEKLNDYLGSLKLVNFLIGFFVILYPFLFGQGYNILFAILSMVLLRQSLNMLNSFVGDSVSLAKARHRVNTLVFRHFQLEQKERSVSAAVRDLFSNAQRESLAKQYLDNYDYSLTKTEWVDSEVPGAKVFKICLSGNEVKDKYFLCQVFPAGKVAKITNEAFLFEHVSRSKIMAPAVVSRFSVGPFECQVYDYGCGEPIPDEKWSECEQALLANLWACQPSVSLVEAYAASHPTLDKLLKEEFVSRVAVAVDTERESEILKEFVEVMPFYLKYLSRLPVYIYNPDVRQGNVVISENEKDFLIITWARWKILPLGAAFPKRLKGEQLESALSTVRTKRRDVGDDFTVKDVNCANLGYELERAIRSERYKAALEIMSNILAYKKIYQLHCQVAE